MPVDATFIDTKDFFLFSYAEDMKVGLPKRERKRDLTFFLIQLLSVLTAVPIKWEVGAECVRRAGKRSASVLLFGGTERSARDQLKRERRGEERICGIGFDCIPFVQKLEIEGAAGAGAQRNHM